MDNIAWFASGFLFYQKLSSFSLDYAMPQYAYKFPK